MCKNHPELAIYAKGLCRSCYEKQLKSLNSKYAERQRQNSLKWGRANSELKSISSKERRIKLGPQSEIRFKNIIKQKFGLSIEDYNSMMKSQNNLCKICNRTPAKGKKLHLDHNHKTNKVRGLLCAQCNWYLGFIEKDYSILQNILDYLKIDINGKSKEI